MTEEQLKHMSSMELVMIQSELRGHPEDKEFLDEVLKELGRRQRKDNTL